MSWGGCLGYNKDGITKILTVIVIIIIWERGTPKGEEFGKLLWGQFLLVNKFYEIFHRYRKNGYSYLQFLWINEQLNRFVAVLTTRTC